MYFVIILATYPKVSSQKADDGQNCSLYIESQFSTKIVDQDNHSFLDLSHGVHHDY